MRRDSTARAGRKYRRFFAQLVMKPGKMAITSQSFTMIWVIFDSACLLRICLRVEIPWQRHASG